jgi:hypothetical protein
MARQKRREADGQTHHPPKSVEQQSEDSFPTSDPPSFSGGQTIGAPPKRKSDPANPRSQHVKAAEHKLKSRNSRDPCAD